MGDSRFRRGLQATVAADFLRIASSGLLVLLLTRYLLTPGEYGSVFLVLAILAVTDLFGTLGIARATARFVPEYREQDPGQLPYLLRTALRYNLLSILAVTVAMLAAASVLGARFGQDELGELLLVGVGLLVFRPLSTYAYLVCQGFNRVSYSAVIRGLEAVGQLVFVVGFVAIGWGTAGAIGGYVLATAIAATVGLALVYTQFYRQYEPADERDRTLTGRVLRYSVPLTATKGANVLDTRVDIILVGALVGPVAAGFYTLGKQVVDFLMAPANALGFTISPVYGEKKAEGSLAVAGETYKRTLEDTLLFYFPAAIGLVLVAPRAIEFVFGARYLGAVPVLQVLAGYVVLQAVTNITSDGLDFLGRASARALGKGVTSLANLGLNLLLIPEFGAVGAAAATVATHSVYVGINLYVVHQELQFPLVPLLRTTGLVLGITGLVALVVVVMLPALPGLFGLGATVVAAVVTWGIAGLTLGLIEPRRLVESM